VQRHLLSLSLGHDAAPLAVRERASLDAEQAEALLRRLSDDPDIAGALVLSTCGRVEIYVTGVHWKRMRSAVDRELGENARLFRERRDAASALHLFRVATGLESPLLGESQILGQVRAAARLARRTGSLDTLLSGTADRAIAAARLARHASGLGRGAGSIGQAAVATLRSILGSVAGAEVLVVGAGEVGSLAAAALAKAGASLKIASRSRAGTLPLDEVPAALSSVDAAVFSASTPEPLLRAADIARRERPLLLLDLGVPRNVDPDVAQVPGVRLVNVDEVSSALATAAGRRHAAAERAGAVLVQELASWSDWTRSAAAGPTLAALAAYADGIREREVQRTLRAIGDADPEVRRRVEALSRALVSRLMLHPISYVRAHPDDRAAGELLQRLFSESPGRLG
jgi:glutamyl-tRNA reductase